MIEGFDVAHHPWSLEGALRMREAIRDFKGGDVVIGVTGPYFRCPPAPYEVAGQMDFVLRSRGMRKRSSITVFHPDPAPLAGMGPAISGLIMEILSNKGVIFEGNFTPQRIDKERHVVVGKDGRELPFDMLIMVPPHKPSALVRDLPPTPRRGSPWWIPRPFGMRNTRRSFSLGTW